MSSDTLIRKYDRPVPRYTSYPTAPHFGPDVDGAAYADWLAELPPDLPLSLYLHVPFCDQLCWFCGCHTTVARGDGPRRDYARLLLAEIALAARRIGRRQAVRHIHWGGGTPTALPGSCLLDVHRALREAFDLAPGAEIAVEIDPRTLAEDRLAALAEMGATRASLGVQDFDPRVQQAIHRIQPRGMTESCVERLRGIGIGSVNLDLVYGLPRQTEESAADTARQTLEMRPDRIAVFGYAHVPWMKPHQKLLPEDALPGAAARFAQRAAIDDVLTAAGYAAIGLDHYARPGDSLAAASGEGTLRRNFQGYTTDDAPALLGFGASAIGSLPQGYAQNRTRVPDYAADLREGKLPVARGVRLSDEDRLRRDVIFSLMCGFAVDLPGLARHHGADPDGLAAPARATLRDMAADGVIRWDGARVEVTEAGRPLVRAVAAVFDAYLRPDAQRHSRAV